MKDKDRRNPPIRRKNENKEMFEVRRQKYCKAGGMTLRMILREIIQPIQSI